MFFLIADCLYFCLKLFLTFKDCVDWVYGIIITYELKKLEDVVKILKIYVSNFLEGLVRTSFTLSRHIAFVVVTEPATS
jgi:hypothetical protein